MSLTCALSDAILIAAGVAGFGAAVAALPWLETAMRYGGAAFLFLYAARSLRAALRCHHDSLTPSENQAAGLWTALATCLAFTWLNPHVYLDTVVLLGSISSQYEGQKTAFALGAISASFLFFFTLGYGARCCGRSSRNRRPGGCWTCWWPWRCSVSVWDCLSEFR